MDFGIAKSCEVSIYDPTYKMGPSNYLTYYITT